MKTQSINPWTETVLRQGNIQLRVHHPSDQEGWPDFAAAYWVGELDGLTELASSSHAAVHRREQSPVGQACCIKRFLPRDWRDRLKSLFRASRARRALMGGGIAQDLGFAAPRALCLIETRCAGFPGESALITEIIHDAPDVRAWLNRRDEDKSCSSTDKRALIRAFAAEVGAWHRNGLYHGDMRLGNILCFRREGAYCFVWLDNERTRLYARLPMPRRLQNLVQVNMETRGVTLCDRIRFWNAYAEAAGIPDSEHRKIMRLVLAGTRKRWEKRGWL